MVEYVSGPSEEAVIVFHGFYLYVKINFDFLILKNRIWMHVYYMSTNKNGSLTLYPQVKS